MCDRRSQGDFHCENPYAVDHRFLRNRGAASSAGSRRVPDREGRVSKTPALRVRALHGDFNGAAGQISQLPRRPCEPGRAGLLFLKATAI
jgi:hypothetical protein